MNAQDLIGRVERLEAANRRLKMLFCLAALITAAMLALGAESSSKIIEGNELVLHDKTGSNRLKMAIDESGPYIQMFDGRGRPRAVLLVRDDGALFVLQGGTQLKSNLTFAAGNDPAFSITDNNGKLRAGLLTKEGVMRFVMTDPEQRESMIFAAAREGPSMSFMEGAKKPRAILAVTGNATRLSLLDPRSTERLSMFAGGDEAWCTLNDENSVRRAMMYNRTNRGGAFGLFGKYGDPIWTPTAGEDIVPPARGASPSTQPAAPKAQ